MQAWVDPLGLEAAAPSAEGVLSMGAGAAGEGVVGRVLSALVRYNPVLWVLMLSGDTPQNTTTATNNKTTVANQSDVCASLSDKCNESKRNRCRKWGRGTYTQAKIKVQRGQAPKGIVRIDPPHGGAPNAMVHAHSKNGGAYNLDGSIKDHMPDFKQDDLDFLYCHGWKV